MSWPDDRGDSLADGDAAWVAAQAAGSVEPTRTGVPYNEMSHGGQPGEQTKTDYDTYKHTGQQG